jgi:hypothetical protein
VAHSFPSLLAQPGIILAPFLSPSLCSSLLALYSDWGHAPHMVTFSTIERLLPQASHLRFFTAPLSRLGTTLETLASSSVAPSSSTPFPSHFSPKTEHHR